jgi:DNA-directed RNA polymerase subunit M/transcription elongation factor TFIIS
MVLVRALNLPIFSSDRVPDRVDGWREGPVKNVPGVPAHVLAAGTQGANVDKLTRRTHEHGREVEAEDGLRSSRGRVAVSLSYNDRCPKCVNKMTWWYARAQTRSTKNPINLRICHSCEECEMPFKNN